MTDDRDATTRLSGKVAIVTGGTDPIGRAVAEALSGAGVQVEAVESVELESVESIRSFVRRTAARFGRLDILANLAMTTDRQDVMTMTPEVWDRAMAVTLRAAFFMTQAFAGEIISSGGRGAVVNLAENAAFRPAPLGSVESAARGGIVALSRTLAFELAPHRIRVNVVAPDIDADSVTPEDVAPAVVFLAGDTSSGLTGACINVTRGGFMPH